jgi:beta-phosphoglucomutase-like phosphatase (HAD superfamily)
MVLAYSGPFEGQLGLLGPSRSHAERLPVGVGRPYRSPRAAHRGSGEVCAVPEPIEAVVFDMDLARGKPAPDVCLETARRLGSSLRVASRSRTRRVASAPPMRSGCA